VTRTLVAWLCCALGIVSLPHRLAAQETAVESGAPADRADVPAAVATPAQADSGLGHRQIERQLAWMRELIIGLRETNPRLFGAPGLGRQVRAPSANGATLDKVSERFEQELNLLEQTVWELRKAQSTLGPGIANGRAVYGPEAAGRFVDGVLKTVQWQLRSDGQKVVELPEDLALVNTSWQLANEGAEAVALPRLRVNGFGGWRNLDEVVSAALGGSGELLSPRERAERIWRFVVAHRFHSDPASAGIESHDPVKLLNIYGYGFCDDGANVLAAIARAAGIPARIWGLGGHVVPEVFYDERWHMFDPDNEVYYVDREGLVASVEQLVAEPQLFARPTLAPGRRGSYYGPGWAAPIFTSSADNRLASYALVTQPHTMMCVLRPGEQLILWHGDGPRRFTNGYLQRASQVGNGQWRLEQLLPPGPDSQTVEFLLPWPILSGSLSLSQVTSATRVELRLGDQSFQLTPISDGAAGDGAKGGAVSLAGLFATGEAMPDYGLSLMLSGLPTAGARLEVLLDFQHAAAALPQLHGGSNTLSCEGLTEGAALQWTLGYVTQP
jgi:hypothetical protein